MNWNFYRDLSECSPHQLYEILKLRQDIFIIEQDCIYDDIDGLDYSSAHLLLLDSVDTLIGYLRIVPAGKKFSEPSLGRIAVKKEYRRQGLGKKLIKRGISEVQKKEIVPIRIEAQAQLENYYCELGFTTVSKIYDVDGIPHLQMLLKGEGTNQ